MSFVRLVNGESYPAPNGTKQALLELLAEHISKYGDKNLTLSELGKDPRMPEGTKMNIYSTHFGSLGRAINDAKRRLPDKPLSSTIAIPAEVAEKIAAKPEESTKESPVDTNGYDSETEVAADDFVEYEELDSATEPEESGTEESEQPAVDEPEMELRSITAEPIAESEEPKPEPKKRRGGTAEEEMDELCENFKKLCTEKGYVIGQTEQRKLKKEGANIPSWETLKKHFGPAETWPELFGLPLGYRLTPERGNRSKEKPAPKKSATRLPKAEPVNSKTAPVEAPKPKPAVEIGPAIVTTPVAQTTPGTIEVEVTIPVKVKFNFNLEATFSFNTQ